LAKSFFISLRVHFRFNCGFLLPPMERVLFMLSPFINEAALSLVPVFASETLLNSKFPPALSGDEQ